MRRQRPDMYSFHCIIIFHQLSATPYICYGFKTPCGALLSIILYVYRSLIGLSISSSNLFLTSSRFDLTSSNSAPSLCRASSWSTSLSGLWTPRLFHKASPPAPTTHHSSLAFLDFSTFAMPNRHRNWKRCAIYYY